MATTINGSTNSAYWTHKLVVTENSTSVANNTSSVTVDVYIGRGSSAGASYMYGADIDVTIGVTGCTSKTFNYSNTSRVNIAAGAWLKIGSVTFPSVPHDDDGTKKVTVTSSFTNTISPSSGSASGSVTLATIPRKSSLTVANGTLGTAQTLTVTRKSDSFTHTITYKCGNTSGTICTKSSSTSISFTPPISLAAQNTTGTSVSITYTITTYSGSTEVGSNTYTATCTIPSSVVPTVSFTVSDGKGYLSTYGGYVQGKSTFKIAITASGTQGSSIKSYKTTADGKTYTTASITSSVIAGSGTLTITVTVTDSRGRTATATKDVTVLAYAAPKVTALKAVRCNSSGTSSSSGAYLKITFSAAITSLNSKNGATYVLQYKKRLATSYSSVTLSSYTGKYSVSGGTYILSADTASSYEIILKATDNFSSATSNTNGSSVKKLISRLINNLGIAFGKVAELADYFECEFKAKFNKGVGIGKEPENENTFECDFPAQFNKTLTVNGVNFSDKATWEYCFRQREGTSTTDVNVDEKQGNEYQGVYFIQSSKATGTQPYSDGYYFLLVFGNVQIALRYSSFDMWVRSYTNSAWTAWKNYNKDTYLPLSGGTMTGSLITSGGLSTGNKTGSADGKTGIILPANGIMHLQHSSTPAIYFYAGTSTTSTTYICGNTSGNLFLTANGKQVILTSDRLRGGINDNFYLGDSTYKWKAVYAVNGTIQTSDRNQKENIVSIGEKYEELFKRLKPVTFELKGSEHDRIHVGLIAQDVKEVMDEVGLTDKDLAAYCVDTKREFNEEKNEDVEVLDENGKPIELYSLRYTEFIALNTHMIQKANEKIQKQQEEIDSLKKEIEELKNLIKSTLS